MAIPSDFYYFIISYGGIILILYLFLNWLTAGFLAIFLKIKTSRGKKLLVRVHGRLNVYNIVGWLEGGDLLYYDKEAKNNKQKTPKRLTLSKDDNNAFYRFLGVYCIDVDEATNGILTKDMKGVSAFDPIRWNNLLARALAKPSAEEEKKIIPIITFILVILLLFILIYLAVQVGQLKTMISILQNRIAAALPTGNAIAGVTIP